MAHLLVVGPGALGTLFAVRLQRAGHEVTVACRTAATAKKLGRTGLRLEDARGEYTVSCQTILKPKQLAAPVDGIIIATKCAATQKAVQAWGSNPGVPLICLQNGIPPEGARNMVPCIVGFPASWQGPGQSLETGRGSLYIGTWPVGEPTRAAAMAAEWLADVAPVVVSKNMRGVAWSKLLINSAGSVGAMTGHSMGDLLRLPAAKQAFLDIVAEGYAAGLAEGVRFERVAGFHPALLGRARNLGGRRLQFLILGVIGRKYRRMKSSSLQSLERGQKTEVAWLNGHISATAKRHGLSTPANDAVISQIEAIERGDTTADLALLAPW